MYTHTYTHVYTCMCIPTHIHMQIYTYMHVQKHTYIHTYMNTHTTCTYAHTQGHRKGKVLNLPHSQKSLEAPRDCTEDEDFLSMIKKPPEVGAVRIHMDPESLDTSFGGLTASTFQGVATLITLAGLFKMEGACWHLLSKVFSSLEDMKTDL